jgi:hypothetical protein
MMETWSAENSKNYVSRLVARCILLAVTDGKGVLTCVVRSIIDIYSALQSAAISLSCKAGNANGSQYPYDSMVLHEPPRVPCGGPRFVRRSCTPLHGLRNRGFTHDTTLKLVMLTTVLQPAVRGACEASDIISSL